MTAGVQKADLGVAKCLICDLRDIVEPEGKLDFDSLHLQSADMLKLVGLQIILIQDVGTHYGAGDFRDGFHGARSPRPIDCCLLLFPVC